MQSWTSGPKRSQDSAEFDAAISMDGTRKNDRKLAGKAIAIDFKLALIVSFNLTAIEVECHSCLVCLVSIETQYYIDVYTTISMVASLHDREINSDNIATSKCTFLLSLMASILVLKTL